MYLLDTNVISEMRKAANGRADRAVQHWSDRVDRTQLYLSTITILEMEIGVLRMQRKDAVQARHYDGCGCMSGYCDSSRAISSQSIPPSRYVAQPCMFQ